MKTARFDDVVEAAGKPEVHVILTRPEEDNKLQAAIKSHRVMTIEQRLRGKADRGSVGFDPGPSRQFLIFPHSLSQFAGRYIMAIKYELLKQGDTARRPASSPATKTKERNSARKPTREKTAASKIIPFVKPQELAKSRPRDREVIKDPGDQVDDAIGLLKQGKQASALKLLRKVAKDLRPARSESSKSS